jgi:hypothetical protein
MDCQWRRSGRTGSAEQGPYPQDPSPSPKIACDYEPAEINALLINDAFQSDPDSFDVATAAVELGQSTRPYDRQCCPTVTMGLDCDLTKPENAEDY